ncbi:MAG TPA: ATP-binding protein [Conexibacter sp.]|nr:ATP-binding protein [Conexibacter sp.]
MRRGIDPILLRGGRPGWPLGLVAAAGSVAAATAVVYGLKQIAPVDSLGVVYVLPVLVLSIYWGLGLGLLTALLSAAAFNFFHLPPVGRFAIADSRDWVGLLIFLGVALAASSLAEVARTRAAEAIDRRREADLAVELARLLLGGGVLHDALALATRRLAEAIGAASASIELDAVESDARHTAIPLHDGTVQIGTLVVPAELEPAQAERLRTRIVPALESILAAALARERLQAEVVETASLRRSDEIKTAVLRSVSHDLRTPVTAIRAGASALRSPGLSEQERDEVELGIISDATRLSRLIEKLLDLSRLQAGTAEPHPTWCAIDEVLHEAVAHVEGDPATFTFALDPDLPLVRADATQLERAFANLVENAARYAAGKPVSLRARVVGRGTAGKAGGRLLVRVVDQGPGIAPAEHERIFSPFYRSPRTSGDERGSGLGLTIAKQFIEANGGRISVESLPGQGTSFVVEFPVELVADGAAFADAPAGAS